MNQFLKLSLALFASLTLSLSAYSQADGVSINGYPDGAQYFVRSEVRTPITPLGCVNGTASFTFLKTESNSTINPFEGEIITGGPGAFNYLGWRAIIGSDTIYTTSNFQKPDVFEGRNFQSLKYTLTCTSRNNNQVVSKTLTLVTSRNDQFSPQLVPGKSPEYTGCLNPINNSGISIKFEVNRTLNNTVYYKKPLDASATNSMVGSGSGYVANLADGDVQDGSYQVIYKYLDYYDPISNSIVAGGNSAIAYMPVNRKIANPTFGNGSLRGLTVLINDSTIPQGSGPVCTSDVVRLNWENFDRYYGVAAYRDNYDFVFEKDDNFGRFVEVGRNQNQIVLNTQRDLSYLYRLSFVPKNSISSVGCPSGTPITSSSPILAAPFAAPTILGDAQVCPDGSINLSVNPASTATDFVWKNASGQTVSTDKTLTVSAAGTYSIQFKDTAIKNVLGQVCSSPVASKQISSFNKPTAPIITSTGKTEYCDYTTISDVLTASTNWTEASISKWEWTSTASNGSVNADASKYNAKGFGNYSVRYQDANGCFSSTSSNFVITALPRPAKPTIRLTGSAYNCARDANGNVISVRFDLSSTALAGAKYQWYNGTNAISNATASSLTNVVNSSTISLVQIDGTTACESVNSDAITVNFQANPNLTGNITKTAYTLNASGFAAAGAAEYLWKTGSTVLGSTAVQKIASNGAADYTVARFVNYTLGNNTIKCLSNSASYQYVPDPEFAGIIVYPNPANSLLNIDVLDIAAWNGSTLNVYDMAGRLLITRTISSFPLAIDNLNLGNGIYILNLNNTSGNVYQTKLVINR